MREPQAVAPSGHMPVSMGRRPPQAPRPRARAVPLHKPDLLLLLIGGIVLTSLWRFQDIVPGLSGLMLPLIVSSIASAVFLLDNKPGRQLKNLRSPITLLLLLLGALLVVSTLESINVARSRSFMVRDFSWSLVTFILVACSIRNLRDLRWLIGVHLIGVTSYCIVVLIRFRALDGLGRLCCTPYYDANDISLVLVSTIPWLFFFLRDNAEPRARTRAIIAIPPLLVTFQLAGSRGGFLGLSAVILGTVFLYTGIKPSKRVWAVVGALTVLLVLGGSSYREKLASIFKPEDDYNTKSEDGRVKMWKSAIALARQRPSFGYGPRSFGEAYGTYSPRAVREGGTPWRAAHNAYLELAADAGIPAAVCYVAILLSSIALSWRVRSRMLDPRFGTEGRQLAMLAQSNAIGYAGYIITAVFLSAEYLTISYFMFAMTVVLVRLMKDLEKRASAQRPHVRPGPSAVRRPALPRLEQQPIRA